MDEEELPEREELFDSTTMRIKKQKSGSISMRSEVGADQGGRGGRASPHPCCWGLAPAEPGSKPGSAPAPGLNPASSQVQPPPPLNP